MELPEGAIDLGHNTYYTKVFRGDEWVAIHEWHQENGMWGAGFIAFTHAIKPEWWAGGPTWEVLKQDPLTLSPSLACRSCGHHGFIRDGRWVPA